MVIDQQRIIVPRPTQFDGSEPQRLLSERKTSTVTIRHVELEDAKALQNLLAEPAIIHWTAELPFSSLENIHQHFIQKTENRYNLVACTGQEIVGFLGMATHSHPRLQHTARLGPIAVHPHWQGQGIGSKLMNAVVDLADNWLNLHRLDLLVFSDNEAAIGLYKKFGFIGEGTLRDMAFRAGRYADLYIMARFN